MADLSQLGRRLRWGALIAVLGTTCFFAAVARADAPTATARAAALYWSLCAPAGYTVLSNEDTDVLASGRFRDYTVVLQAGVSYCIFAAGDQRIEDLDIFLYDENSNIIDRDTSRDAIPSVSVTPAWTGRFTLRIKNYKGYGAGYYTVGIAR
jgi:hypothetical protein